MSIFELTVMASASISGPVVAVLLSVWAQNRMEARHREFQIQFTKQIEDERRKYEMTREDAQAKYIDAWNIANRDRDDIRPRPGPRPQERVNRSPRL